MHILSECSKLAQAEYKKRHDKVATMVHYGNYVACMVLNLPITGINTEQKIKTEHRAERVVEIL